MLPDAIELKGSHTGINTTRPIYKILEDFDEDGWGSEKKKDEENEDAGEEHEDTVNPNAVVTPIRNIVKSIRCSSKKRQLFEGSVKVACPYLTETHLYH